MAKPHALFLFRLLLLVNACRPSHQQDQNKISSGDMAALAAVKESLTDIPGSNFFATWDFTAPDPCSTFSGITCSLGRVTTLTLGTGLSNSRGLAGFLCPSVSNLTGLTQLVLYPGLVTGPIPPQLGLLRNLRVLSLTNNRLKGPHTQLTILTRQLTHSRSELQPAHRDSPAGSLHRAGSVESHDSGFKPVIRRAAENRLSGDPAFGFERQPFDRGVAVKAAVNDPLLVSIEQHDVGPTQRATIVIGVRVS
ncbi:LEUCINE-RICH REPEAT (LRR) FAMILY PROTEIN [Salix viminalis]|uniref:LEUCINE-RICH REPEAT (LRR) FAMILY PROTEIN n=1 Tax=Salix viminalis TaxID=40686 RepID=A0A9Q0Z8J9_SALVM|nr:LEUCINE-RICH REPEAT (LRR) FAMILY PROTEIN [Salix viminalis]